MPNPLVDSTVPVNDKFLTHEGLVSRTWLNFILWIRRRLLQLQQGPQQVTQAQIAATQAALGFGEVGFLIWVTDHNHILRWTGATWSFYPGTEVSNWYALFDLTGDNPGTGWVRADGSLARYLKSNGTLGTITTQIIADTWYRI